MIAQGYEHEVPMSVAVEGKRHEWVERRLVVRSPRHGAAGGGRLASPGWLKPRNKSRRSNRRGRGRRRFEEIAPLRQAASELVQRHQVEGLLRLRYAQHTATRQVRAYGGRPAYVEQGRQATVEVEVDEAALGLAVRRLGWRVYSTNQPLCQLSLEQAVLAYRHEYLVERSLGRLKGRPLSLRPMYVQRDDHATGLIRLLAIALRVLTLLEFVVRRQLAASGATLTQLYHPFCNPFSDQAVMRDINGEWHYNCMLETLYTNRGTSDTHGSRISAFGSWFNTPFSFYGTT